MPQITEIVDVGKVWPKVKLEQVIYILSKGKESPIYAMSGRKLEEILPLGIGDKSQCAEFGFIFNGLNVEEIAVGQKIKNAGSSLGAFVSNTRGAMFQSMVEQEGKGKRVIGGAHVQNEGLKGQKGILKNSETLPPQAFVKPDSVLAQNIVAHIANPKDHIKITACVVEKEEAKDIVILDTVNQLTNLSELPSRYISALLTSKLINWFVYRFIFAKAIRTMHFDAPVTNRIPIFDASLNEETKKIAAQIAKLDEERQAAKQDGANSQSEAETRRSAAKIASLDRRIDALVYELYGLTDAEIELVEA